MYNASPEPSRPASSLSTGGLIPAVAHMESAKIPDNNIIQYHNEKAREQWAITKQVRLFESSILNAHLLAKP